VSTHWDQADQVVGDQIEHEIGANAADAAMSSLAHRTVLLRRTEDISKPHQATTPVGKILENSVVKPGGRFVSVHSQLGYGRRADARQSGHGADAAAPLRREISPIRSDLTSK
jgi:hypothetical protein